MNYDGSAIVQKGIQNMHIHDGQSNTAKSANIVCLLYYLQFIMLKHKTKVIQ